MRKCNKNKKINRLHNISFGSLFKIRVREPIVCQFVNFPPPIVMILLVLPLQLTFPQFNFALFVNDENQREFEAGICHAVGFLIAKTGQKRIDEIL